MSASRTVLLIEDEEQVRNLLIGLLTAHAWRVTAVASGQEALAQLEHVEFDIVLCDLDLGRGPDGLDVLSRMPIVNEETPFVLLTAHGSTGRCRDAFIFGAADFLEKPISRGLLLATLDHAVSDASETSELPIDIASPDDVLELPYDEAGAALVRRGVLIIEGGYRDSDLTIARVAREAGASPEHFSRQFRLRIGRSPVQYLHNVRIRHAERLLANSDLSIYEIGCECGYKRNSEFSSWFRRLRGSTPSKSRRAR